MYRFLFRPRWLLGFVGCVAFAALCALAGLWQFDRSDQRGAINDRVSAGSRAEPVDVRRVLSSEPLPVAAEHRRVRATGRFEPAGEVLVRGRSLKRQAGVYVLTPLRADDGDRVLVARGWVPLSDRGADVVPRYPAPPTGEVTLVGRARRAEPATGGLGRIGAAHSVQRIDPAVLRPVTGAALSGYVELISPAQDGLVAIPTPDLGGGPHLAYGVQWFLFAVLSFVGYGIYARREAEARAAGAVAASENQSA